MIRWIYKQCVIPAISHGAICWVHKSENKSMMNKLNRLPKIIANMMCNTYRSMPVESVEILLELKSISICLREAATKSAIQRKKLGDWKALNGVPGNYHGKYIEKLLGRKEYNIEGINVGNTELLKNRTDNLDEKEIIEGKFNVEIGSEFPKNATDPDKKVLLCYSDGSKLESGECGAGYIYKSQDKELRGQKCINLDDTHTVYQAN